MYLVRDWGWFPHQNPREYVAVLTLLGEVIMCGHYVDECSRAAAHNHTVGHNCHTTSELCL